MISQGLPEPYVGQIDIAALEWEQFRAVMDVYRHWVAEIWHHADTRTYGVRLRDVPLLSIDGLHQTVVGVPAPIGIPTDGREDG